ncbi:ParD-like family protein [Zhongshania aquimaris]|uniref:ParD-like family protein n=1 Tax=Zhongshania aquimaris TaxID=2857107 RepID=UPI002105547E|nr:ParD-like family protein [Zhongshania aquimaris]
MVGFLQPQRLGNVRQTAGFGVALTYLLQLASFVAYCYNISNIDPKEDITVATTSIRLDQDLIDKATIMARALNRTPPKQIEHWAKIGEMMEDNPDLPYEFVKQAIIAKAEKEAGKLESYDFG